MNTLGILPNDFTGTTTGTIFLTHKIESPIIEAVKSSFYLIILSSNRFIAFALLRKDAAREKNVTAQFLALVCACCNILHYENAECMIRYL